MIYFNGSSMGTYQIRSIINRYRILTENIDIVEKIYQDSLEYDCWKHISDKFPNYNSPNSKDHTDAVDYVFDCIKTKNSDNDWEMLTTQLKSKISDGIS